MSLHPRSGHHLDAGTALRAYYKMSRKKHSEFQVLDLKQFVLRDWLYFYAISRVTINNEFP